MKFFSFGSISRNLIILVVIAVLPALTILLYTGIEQRNRSIDGARKDVTFLTNSMAEVQRDITHSCRQTLSTLALLPEIQALNLAAGRKIFAALLKENPGFHNIALTDLTGNVLIAGRGFKPTNLGDRKHFKGALATKKFAAGEFIVTRLGAQTQVFPFAYPILDDNGNPKAVLTTAVDLSRYSHFYATAKLPEDSFIAATDHQGVRLIYYPPKETNPVGKKIKGDSWDIARNAQESGIFSRKGSDGRERLFAFQQLRLTPEAEPYMYVWAGIPEQSIVKAANAALTRNLLLMVLVTTLALAIAWFIGTKRLVLPIKNLVELTRNFADGKLDARLESGFQPNEFGSLTNAFYDMAEALKQGQQALLQNEARFRIVMDSVDALVYVADMETYEILFINQYGRDIFGDITGKICWENLQTGQTGPCPFCTNEFLLDNNGQPGKIYTWEFQNTVSGNWYFIHDRAIRWIDDRIVRLEIATDITERKQAEAKLAEETERLDVTLKSIGDGVISCDTEGKVQLINQVAEELTGWQQEEATGRPLNEVFSVININTGQPIANPVAKSLEAEEVVGLPDQNLLIDKEGVEKNISYSYAPIRNKAGWVIGVVLVFRDITEHLRTEQELIKVKKLESIGVLAGGIAHDFNNILAAILGNIDLSMRDSGLSDTTQRRLKQAQTASFRARDLTQQLLTFAKGGQPIKETASLADVVKESADFVLRGDKVACRYQLPEDLLLVDIDKGQISQVIQNIIINASHAMPNGGLIEVTAQNASAAELDNLNLAEAEQFIKLEITDNGVGIPKKIIDRIFDPYFTTKQEGSGLGLAISHSIIHKHGGTISVKSEPEIGTTFSIVLPASLQNRTEKTKVTETIKNHKKAKILVMDDEAVVREIAQEMLEEMGHKVFFAEDGLEAIQLYLAKKDDSPFDLAIMDLTIPGGVGGKDAMEQLLTIDPNAKVIVSSGYSNDPIMANYANYGFAAAIAKPYQFSELNQVISQLLS